MTVHIGIDPGIKGGLAVIEGNTLRQCEPMPTIDIPKGKGKQTVVSANMLASELAAYQTMYHGYPIHVYVEIGGTRPKEGNVSARKNGRNAGIIEGVIAGLFLPVTYLTANAWTKWHGVGADKGRHVQRACELWPKWTNVFYGARGGLRDGLADAALIAEWGRNEGVK